MTRVARTKPDGRTRLSSREQLDAAVASAATAAGTSIGAVRAAIMDRVRGAMRDGLDIGQALASFPSTTGSADASARNRAGGRR